MEDKRGGKRTLEGIKSEKTIEGGKKRKENFDRKNGKDRSQFGESGQIEMTNK